VYLFLSFFLSFLASQHPLCSALNCVTPTAAAIPAFAGLHQAQATAGKGFGRRDA
jgi:hypothetical protein